MESAYLHWLAWPVNCHTLTLASQPALTMRGSAEGENLTEDTQSECELGKAWPEGEGP